MMIFNFISGILFSLIIPGLGLGTLLLILSAFIPPTFVMYKAPIQIAGAFLLVLFLFQAGRYSEVQKNEKARLEAIALIAELKAKSEKVNTETVVRYVDRVKVVDKIKEVKTNVYITEKADAACPIDISVSGATARLLNSAAIGRVPDATPSIDGSPK